MNINNQHLSARSIRKQNNAANTIKATYRDYKARQNLALRTALDIWVNEEPNEREVRQQVKNQI